MSTLPINDQASNSRGGFIHFTLLLVLTLILFLAFVIVPRQNLVKNITRSYVLSNETEDDEDIEELEFEDGDDDEDDDEDELVEGDSEQKVELKIKDGKVVIKVKTKNRFGRETEEELEATSSSQIASLKIKAKEGEVKLVVKTEDGKIILVEEGVNGEIEALTNLPLTIDSENNVVVVHSPDGDINIDQFPAGVFEALLSAAELNQLESLQLNIKVEDGKTKVVYHAKGQNNVNFLGIFKVDAEIEAEVDAQTGETEVVSQPWYLKYLNFLFTS